MVFVYGKLGVSQDAGSSWMFRASQVWKAPTLRQLCGLLAENSTKKRCFFFGIFLRDVYDETRETSHWFIHGLSFSRSLHVKFLFGISEEKPIFRQWRLRTCLTCWPCWPLGCLPIKGNEAMKWRFIQPPQKRPNQQSILRMFSDVSQARWSHQFPFLLGPKVRAFTKQVAQKCKVQQQRLS